MIRNILILIFFLKMIKFFPDTNLYLIYDPLPMLRYETRRLYYNYTIQPSGGFGGKLDSQQQHIIYFFSVFYKNLESQDLIVTL